jgi:hypothetical protein
MNLNSRENGYQSDVSSKREGRIARQIEQQTAKIPSDVFLWAAGAAVIGSLALQIAGMVSRTGQVGFFGGPLHAKTRAPLASFIGMWVPSLLLLGVYNKIVKVAGSDRVTG